MPTRRIEWSEKLSTGLRSIDNQHAGLINSFNDFVEAIEADEKPDTLRKLFKGIIDEVQSHFAFEEQIMVNIGFPDAMQHKAHHISLATDALEVLKELESLEKADDAIPSVNFLRHLVVKHMVEQDLKLKDFITSGCSGPDHLQ